MPRRWLEFLFTVLMVALMAPCAEAKHHARRMTAANLNPNDFVNSVTNKFFPLVPGTTFHYEGQKDGIAATNDTTVLRTTKTILGVKCTAVQDVAHEEGKLVEKTFDWYAQDKAGNVWYFGEDSTAYLPDGTTSKEGSWQAGVNGAEQGIIMEAAPKVGDKYQQENAPGVAQDMAQVMSLDKSLCVPYGCFDDLLLTRESTPLAKGDVEQKYYAPNVGFIYGQALRGGNEFTQLVSVTGN
jgi:hypothetical protein